MKRTKRTYQVVFNDLYSELELRFGSKVATETINQIENLGDAEIYPDYMDVKAFSEVLEKLRDETKAELRYLKACKKFSYANDNEPLQYSDTEQRIFRRSFRSYYLLQNAYYQMIKKALAKYTQAKEVTEFPKTKRVAA